MSTGTEQAEAPPRDRRARLREAQLVGLALVLVAVVVLFSLLSDRFRDNAFLDQQVEQLPQVPAGFPGAQSVGKRDGGSVERHGRDRIEWRHGRSPSGHRWGKLTDRIPGVAAEVKPTRQPGAVRRQVSHEPEGSARLFCPPCRFGFV